LILSVFTWYLLSLNRLFVILFLKADGKIPSRRTATGRFDLLKSLSTGFPLRKSLEKNRLLFMVGVSPQSIKRIRSILSVADIWKENCSYPQKKWLAKLGCDMVRREMDPNFVLIARTDARTAIGGSLEEVVKRGCAYLDAGADVILGNHPHVLQGIEFYKGRPIVHSLGNFIFDIVEPFFTDATLQTFLFGCKLMKGGIRDPYILPCRCGVGDPPKLLSPSRGEGQKIVEMMGSLSKPL
jgi:hypothetical protein